MEKVRVYFDREGNTLSVWFDDPKKEVICEEVNDDVVLMKDKRGRVIGFERLNYLSRKQYEQGRTVPVEVQTLASPGSGEFRWPQSSVSWPARGRS